MKLITLRYYLILSHLFLDFFEFYVFLVVTKVLRFIEM